MKKASRGLALISVLLLSIVLFFLVAAFMGVNKMSLSTLTNVTQESKARQAALSGLDYAVSRLTAKPTFGQVNGAEQEWTMTTSSDSLRVWEKQDGDFLAVVGIMGDAGFQLVFQNKDQPVQDFPLKVAGSVLDNPANPTGWKESRADGRFLSKNLFEVPGGQTISQPNVGFRPHLGGTCNVQVMGFTRDSQVWLDATTNRPAALPFGIQADGHLGVGQSTGGTWSVNSNDRFRNKVAGKLGVVVPDPLSNGHRIQFGSGGGEVVTEHSIELADGLNVDSTAPLQTSSSGVSAVIGDGTNDAGERAQAKAATGADFKDGQSSAASLEFSFSAIQGDLYVPNTPSKPKNPDQPTSDPGGDTEIPVNSLPGGDYVFVADNQIRRISNGLSEDFTDTIGPVTIADGKLLIPADSPVVVDGDFNLTRDPSYTRPVYVALGDVASKKLGVLQVNGHADLEASVVGDGTFVAESLKLEARSKAAALPDNGVTLVTQTGDLTFTSADKSWSASERDTVFKGVALASGNIIMKMDGHDMKIEGALAAKNDVVITNVHDFVNLYEPAHVERAGETVKINPNNLSKAQIVYKSFR